MSTSFPTGLDTLTNPTATDKVAVVSHASQHANANDAIEALQAKVGANGSAVTTSHDYKLSEVTSTDKAVGKSATQTLTNKTLNSPTINNAVMSSPTGITATDVGLGSVTNDAQLKRAAGDLNTFTQKVAPEAADILVIEDSSASYAKKKVLASAFGVGQPGQFLKNFTSRTVLTLGQPVGISNLIDSYVSPSALSSASVAHGVTTPTGSSFLSRARCSIGGDKFVHLIQTSAGSDTLFAQVVSVNTTTNAFTAGTAATVATAFAPNTSSSKIYNVSVCKLDTDKFIVFYVLDSATTFVKYRVGTVSGTTITFGTEADFYTIGSTMVTSNAICSHQISTDKGVVVMKAATSSNSRVVAFTTSGTVATIGTGVALGANNQANNDACGIRKIGTDKFAVVSASGTSFYSQVGTISGTTITLGSEVTTTIGTLNSNADLTIISPATDVYIVLTGVSGGSSANLLAFSVSGTVPTAGSLLTVTGTTIGNNCILIEKDTTTSYLFNIQGKEIYTITRSGTTLTSSLSISKFTSNTTTQFAVYMDNGYPVTCNVDSTDLSGWIYGMSNNFIGFAQSSVSAGQQVAVSYTGIDTNQSGLIAGSAYDPSGGVLTVTANSFTSNTIKAISATEVIF